MRQMSRRGVSCLGGRGDLTTVVVWRSGLWCLSGGGSFGACQSFHSRCRKMHHQPTLSLQEPHRRGLSGWVGKLTLIKDISATPIFARLARTPRERRQRLSQALLFVGCSITLHKQGFRQPKELTFFLRHARVSNDICDP